MIFHRLLLRGVGSMRVWRGGVESTGAWQRSGTRLATDSVARARSYHASFQLSQHGGKVFKLFSEALGRRQTHKVETETYNTGPRSLLERKDSTFIDEVQAAGTALGEARLWLSPRHDFSFVPLARRCAALHDR